MAYFCRICESYLPNEKFSGKGRKIHVCKKCSQMPKEQRHHIEQKQEISDFLQQSNISDKNRSRLSTLSNSTDQEIAMLASIVLEISRVHPRKKRRLKFLAKNRRDLIEKLEETGLIYACYNY